MPEKKLTINGRHGAIKYNDFQTDLHYSLDLSDEKLLDEFYMTKFPFAQSVETVSYGANKINRELQEKGVDKIIRCSNGNVFTIDEKKRRKDYGDILIELWKNKEQHKLGWLFYSQCDYIVYAVIGADKIYLLPTLLLQMAWKTNGTNWLKQYPLKKADNIYYKTVNIAIPTNILITAMQNEMQHSLFAEIIL